MVVGETVDRIDVAGGRVHGVTTARDRRFAADVVVTCAGPAADAIARLAAASLPLVKVPGLVAVARADAIILNAILMAPGINVRPVVGGPLKLHSYDADALIQGPAPGLAAARELLRSRAATLLPRPQPVKFLAATRRAPDPPDGLTSVGPLDGVEGMYAIVTHSAAHLALLLGRHSAEELTGTPSPCLTPFRPQRLDEHSHGSSGRRELPRDPDAPRQRRDPPPPQPT